MHHGDPTQTAKISQGHASTPHYLRKTTIVRNILSKGEHMDSLHTSITQ